VPDSHTGLIYVKKPGAEYLMLVPLKCVAVQRTAYYQKFSLPLSSALSIKRHTYSPYNHFVKILEAEGVLFSSANY
jgi:hypothetical protein